MVTTDPQYWDLYGNFDDIDVGYERWLAKIEEVIDNYQMELRLEDYDDFPGIQAFWQLELAPVD